MEKKELTKEMLVEAANDLNKVLELKPPVATEFTSAFKGAVLKGAEKKFMDQLSKDLIEVATCTDESGKPLLQPTDILQLTTIDVLEALGVQAIRSKLVSGEVSDPINTNKKKGGFEMKTKLIKEKKGNKTTTSKKGIKGPGVISSILDIIKEKGPICIENIGKRLAVKFPDRSPASMLKTVKAQIGGKKRPLRLEAEKKVKFIIENDEFSL